MPFYRRYAKKRGRKSTKPRYVRKRRNYRIARPPKVYTFQRSFRSELTLIPLTNGYSNTNGIGVQLGFLPSSADFTNLFDQYRIKNASLSLIYRGGNVRTQGDTVLNPTHQLPTFFYINDWDDSNQINIDQLLEHQRMHMKQMTNNKTMVRFSVPTYTIEDVEPDATTPGRVPRKSPWLDTSNALVNHGNLKLLIQGTPTVPYVFDMIFKLTVQGKNPR